MTIDSATEAGDVLIKGDEEELRLLIESIETALTEGRAEGLLLNVSEGATRVRVERESAVTDDPARDL